MPYLYLIVSVFGSASTSVLGSLYNRKNEGTKGSAPLYNFAILASVFIGWLILFLIDGTFDWAVLPYSLLFSVSYTVCAIATIYALKTGPVVLSALILQLSLIGVTAWGFLFWDARFTWMVGVALALIVLSLWLCLYTGKKEEGKISLKWIFWVTLMFIGNAGCSIVQKTQQMKFNGQYGEFLMVTAMTLAVIVCAVIYAFSDKSDTPKILKRSWYYPVTAGACNILLNVCVMLLATSTLSPGLIYPVLAVGGLMITTLFSAFVFKEKMHWWQWVGVALGTVAVVLLSV